MLKRIIVYGVMLVWLVIAPVWFARDRAYQEATAYVDQQIAGGKNEFHFINSNLATIPSNLNASVNPQSLVIVANSLEKLPDDIGEWHSLLYLFLHNIVSTDLVEQLSDLSNLYYLFLDQMTPTLLSPEIGKLTNVGRLSLSGTFLEPLPPEIGNLANLAELILSKTLFTTLPPEIGNLQYLQYLYIYDTNITSLPLEIGKLDSLIKLELNNAPLTSLPPEIGDLERLAKLYLPNSDLVSLPPEIGNLKNLEFLVVSKRQLRLHPEISHLRRFYWLDLRDTQMTSLPAEIGNLTNLRRLDLSGTQITSLPPEIGNLIKLEELNLSGTSLTSLPPEIGNLTNLASLNLSRSSLTSLPPEVAKIHYLISLYLNDTSITSIPSELGALPNLSIYTESRQPDTYNIVYDQATYTAMAIVYGGSFVVFVLICAVCVAIYRLLSRRPRAVITPNKNKDSRRLTLYHMRWIAMLVACLVSFIPFVVYLGDRWNSVDIGNRHFIFVMLGAYVVAYGLTIATTVKTTQRLMQEHDIYHEGNTNRLNLWKNVFRQSIESHIWLVVPRFGIALGLAQIFHTYFDSDCSSLTHLRLLVKPYCHLGENREMFVNMPALLFVLAVLFVFACVECGLVSAMASLGMPWRGIVLRRGLVLMGVLLYIGAYSLYPVRGEFATRLLTQSSETWFRGYNYGSFWYDIYYDNHFILGEAMLTLHETGMSWVDSGILLSADLLRFSPIGDFDRSGIFYRHHSPTPSLISGSISLLGLLLAMAWYMRKLRRG